MTVRRRARRRRKAEEAESTNRPAAAANEASAAAAAADPIARRTRSALGNARVQQLVRRAGALRQDGGGRDTRPGRRKATPSQPVARSLGAEPVRRLDAVVGNAAIQRALHPVVEASGRSAQLLQRAEEEGLSEEAELQERFFDAQGPGSLVRKLGDADIVVAAVQAMLNQLLPEGVPRLVIDRVFGPRTDAAVRAFQWLKEIEIDGIAGDETWDMAEELDHLQMLKVIDDAGMLY